MDKPYSPFAADDRRPAAILIDAVERLGGSMRFSRDEEIYAQEEDADRLYRVVSGVVRTSRFSADGRRQIGSFYYAGDLFGFEVGSRHVFAAEALTDCEVRVARRGAIALAAGTDKIDEAILGATQMEIERLQAHVVLLCRRSAKERVGAFLAAHARNDPSAETELPMSRQDMADYLGLSMETVSRMLTRLQDEAIVDFGSTRRFQVRRWPALAAMAA